MDNFGAGFIGNGFPVERDRAGDEYAFLSADLQTASRADFAFVRARLADGTYGLCERQDGELIVVPFCLKQTLVCEYLRDGWNGHHPHEGPEQAAQVWSALCRWWLRRWCGPQYGMASRLNYAGSLPGELPPVVCTADKPYRVLRRIIGIPSVTASEHWVNMSVHETREEAVAHWSRLKNEWLESYFAQHFSMLPRPGSKTDAKRIPDVFVNGDDPVHELVPVWQSFGVA